MRTIGNIIPPYGASEKLLGAAIEYAVDTLNVSEIIMCGPSDCGGMKAILEGAPLKYAAPKDGVSCPDKLSQKNIEQQIKNLLTYPIVKQKVDAGALTIKSEWVNLSQGPQDR